MPVPSRERIIELLSDLIQRQGYDLEDVTVTLAGKHSSVRVMVDSDAGLELDAVAQLSRTISDVFDAASDFGESPYVLEVTSPGIDRPLTEERHWRRARGRKARIDLAHETVIGRIGKLGAGRVAVVMPGRPDPTVREIALGDIKNAVVQVEFSAPNERELALAGGIPEGRVRPGDVRAGHDEQDEQEGLDK